MWKKILGVCLLGLIAIPTFCAESELKSMPAADFLKLVRRAQGSQDSYAAMEGEVRYRRSGESTKTVPLYLGIWLTPDRTMAQLIIDNRQGYMLGQSYDSGVDGSTILPMGEYEKPLLGEFGLRPGDLTMAFIYWDFDREMPGESYKLQDCRVLLLKSPTEEDWVKVYLSVANVFPLKAEWFKSAEDATDKKPYRTLEISSIRREGAFTVPSQLNIYGPGWRTLVDFDEVKVGKSEPGVVPPVLRKL